MQTALLLLTKNGTKAVRVEYKLSTLGYRMYVYIGE
jgi:hypothetical protein